MPKSKTQPNSAPLTEARLEELLSEQTTVILTAVDERFRGVNSRLSKLEQQYDRLLRTLNKFLKRMTDMEEEFTFMKNDVNRIKAVLREKLGVSFD